jgi:hypothetical protein
MSDVPNERPDLLSTPGLAAGERGPPIAARAINFFRAMGRMLASGGKTVSAEDYEARLTVCDVCEMRSGKWCTHKDCGCDLLFKAALATEDCPIKKWP